MIEYTNGSLEERFTNWREFASFLRSLYLRQFPRSLAEDIEREYKFEVKTIDEDGVLHVKVYTWEYVCFRAMAEIMDLMPAPARIVDMKKSFSNELPLLVDRILIYDVYDTLLTISTSISPRIIE